MFPLRQDYLALPPLCERRDEASRRRILARVRAEFEEMPGLQLTLGQARRLTGLRHDICVRVLDTLVHHGVLRRDDAGRFLRSGRPVHYPD